MMENYPYVSVLVCTHNGIRNGIDKCLDSILQLKYPEEMLELVVVNDASTDNTAECLEGYCHEFSQRRINFRAHTNPQNQGLYTSKSRGIILTHPTTEVIAVTDDDCEVHPDWLIHLIPHYETPSVGSVGGDIDTKNKTTLLERFAADPFNNVLCNPPNARFFHGANCSYRKSALLKVNSFNPETISGGDAEVSFRLKKAGWKLRYEPEAIVYHQHRTTLRGLWRQFKKYGSGDYHLVQGFNDARFTPGEIFWGEFVGACLGLPGRVVCSFREEDAELVLATPFLNMLKSTAWFSGYAGEALSRREKAG